MLLGLDERTGFKPVEKFNLNRVRDQFISGMENDGKQRRLIENAPQYVLERMEFEGGQILVIEISETDPHFKPCYIYARGINNGSYKRVDDKDIKLSPTEIFELQQAFDPSPADKELVEGASLADLDTNLLERLLRKEKDRNSRALRGSDDRTVHLTRLNIIKGEQGVTFAGLMSLGSYPQQFFPRLIVDVAVHPGIQKSKPDGPRFLDRVICEGPIGEAIEESVHAVTRNLRTYSYIEDTGRRDELEIPQDVFREAIANAVVHREYSSRFIGQPITVDIFPNRVEITNPGGLWGGKTLENLGDGQSRCRNSVLMQLISRIDYPSQGSPAEGQGSGVPLMIREMQSHALSAPHFEAGLDYFKVTLQRSGAEIASNAEWVERITNRNLSSLESAILLEARRSQNDITVSALHERLGYDSDEIRKALGLLADDKLLEQTTKDHYVIASGIDSLQNDLTKKKPSSREVILSTLAIADKPIGIKEIAKITGQKISTLRAQMNKLVKNGEVVPTASPTDPKRKYHLP